MSWLKLNDSLNRVRGQITSFAQEVLSEGVDDDEEYEEVNPKKDLEEAKDKINELNNLISTQDNELITLRRQIADFQNQAWKEPETPQIQAATSSSSSKTLPDSHVALEESWFWDPENNISSTSSSSKKEELEDLTTIPLEVSANDFNRLQQDISEKDAKCKKLALENAILNEKLTQVITENKELNESIEELDKQHELAIDEVLQARNILQDKYNAVSKEIESVHLLDRELNDLKKEYVLSCEENARLKHSVVELNEELNKVVTENVENISKYEIEIHHLKKDEESFEERKGKDRIIENITLEKQKALEDLIALQEDHVQLKQQLDTLKVNYELLVQKDTEKNGMIENITLEKQKALEDLIVLQEDCVQLKHQLVNYKLLVQKDTDKNSIIENITLEKQKALEDLIVLQEDHVQLKQQLNTLKVNYELLVQKDTEKNGIIENITLEKQKALEDLIVLQEDHVQLKQQLDTLKANYELLVQKDTEKGKSEELTLLKEQINELNNELRGIIIESSVQLESNEKEYNLRIDKLMQINRQLEEENHHWIKIKEIIKDIFDINDFSVEEFDAILNGQKTKITTHEKKLSDISREKLNLKADLEQYEIECSNLMKNNNILMVEIENLKSNKLETINEKAEESVAQLERQLDELQKTNKQLDDDYRLMLKKLQECEDDKEKLENMIKLLDNDMKLKEVELEKHQKSQFTESSKLNQQLEDGYRNINEKMQEYEGEKDHLENKLKLLEIDLKLKDVECQKLQKFISELKHQGNELSSELNDTKSVDDKEIHGYKIEIENLKGQLKAISDDHNGLVHKLKNSLDKTQNHESTIAELNKTIESLKSSQSNENDLPKLLEETEALRQVITANEKTIDTLSHEKQNLIALITTKHNENIHYHSEIQRLNQLLHIEIEKNTHQFEGQLKKTEDYEKLVDQNEFLKEKSDILNNNLIIEQNNQKVLNQEKVELTEKNNSLNRELERLRQHLLDMEEAHTQETLELQQISETTKAKLISLEEDAKKSSNAFTSQSVRLNQHAETIQAQYKLLQQQRDELLVKLSIAEDKESKNMASLTNLQCALEQFQKNKDRDIELATNAIRNELKNSIDNQKRVQNDIQQLHQQLQDAKNGLQAASRISDQLEISQMQIANLKMDLTKSTEKYEALEKKLKETEESQADKIEKSLVKSLIIGYIVAPHQNDKMQILKLVSHVLSLDQNECIKIGLNQPQGGWLNSILGVAGYSSSVSSNNANYSKESLTAAFVKFLDQESRPRHNPNGPNLLNIMDTPPVSLQAGRSQTPGDINSNPHPILLNESILQESFPAPRNSSAILKDILSDS